MTPDCDETRDRLEAYRRGELTAGETRQVEAHLAACARCRAIRNEDDALVAMLRGLPVTPAPPALRRRIEESARGAARPWWSPARPWVAAAIAAAVVLVAVSPWLPWRRGAAADPVEGLIVSGISEHRRILLQIQNEPTEVADPASAFARVYAATDIALPHAFAGGHDLHLLAARPTLLANRKAAAAVLSRDSKSFTTYFAMPGKDLPMPSERRVQIEQYRPYMREVGGFRAIYWKQGDLAYLMVTDLDDPGSRQLFLRMRKAL